MSGLIAAGALFVLAGVSLEFARRVHVDAWPADRWKFNRWDTLACVLFAGCLVILIAGILTAPIPVENGGLRP